MKHLFLMLVLILIPTIELRADDVVGQDVTSYIVNPNFDDVTLTNRAPTGWLLYCSVVPTSKISTTVKGNGLIAGSQPHWQIYLGSGAVVGRGYQKIGNIPNGHYRLSVAISSTFSGSVQLYANKNLKNVTTDSAGYYEVDTYVINDSLEIGLTFNTTKGVLIDFDSFKLTHFPSGVEDLSKIFYEKINAINDLLVGQYGDVSFLCDYLSTVLDATESLGYTDDSTAITNAIKMASTAIDSANVIISEINTLQSLVSQAQTFATLHADYAGIDTYQDRISTDNLNLQSPDLTEGKIRSAIADLKQARIDFIFSQTMTNGQIDVTEMLQCPKFTDANSVASFAGWINGSIYNSSDFKVKNDTYLGMNIWNSWSNDFTTMDVHQTVNELPNGYYSMSALATTEVACINNQHAYITSELGTAVSPTIENVDKNQNLWATQVTDKVITFSNSVTLGYASASTGGTNGWFKVTDFHLYYHGAVTDEDVKTEFDKALQNARDTAVNMHFGGDKAELEQVINSCATATTTETRIQSMTALAQAVTEAIASQNKYAQIMASGKTIPTVTDSLAKSATAYGAANSIVKYALGKTTDFITAETTTYTLVDNMVTKLSKYASDYATVYNAANDSVSKFTSASAKEVLTNLMASQKTYLVSSDTLYATALVDTCITNLSKTLRVCVAQNKYENNKNATDYTFMIQNPNAGGTVNTTTGWVINRGKGNTDTAAGQHYSGNTALRYFDSWNGTTGALNYYAYQVITNIPNGTYTVKAAGRNGKGGSTVVTDGAFIFASNGGSLKSDTVWQEIKSASYTFVSDATGKDTTVCQGDVYGKIWEVATTADKAGTATALESAEAAANNGIGRGWNWYSLSYEVTNHKIVIGMCTDSLRTGKPFTGQWFSVVDFTLTKTADGDNSDWSGPISGIQNVGIDYGNCVVKGIYNLSGMKINSKFTDLKKGVYIIVMDKKTQKIVVR